MPPSPDPRWRVGSIRFHVMQRSILLSCSGKSISVLFFYSYHIRQLLLHWHNFRLTLVLHSCSTELSYDATFPVQQNGALICVRAFMYTDPCHGVGEFPFTWPSTHKDPEQGQGTTNGPRVVNVNVGDSVCRRRRRGALNPWHLHTDTI